MCSATFSADGFSWANGGVVVQMAVVQRGDDLIEQPFQLVEIHHHADGIQLRRGDRDLHPPVVPVQRLERAVVQPQLDERREKCGWW